MLKSSILAATLAASAVALSGCLIIANDSGTRTVYVSAEEAAAEEMRAVVDYGPVLADPRRLATEVARDTLRKPAEMLAFAQIRPGDAVADIRPEEGYFTRLFAPAVGDNGKVYAFVPNQTAGRENAFADTLASTYSNVSRVTGALEAMSFGSPLDVVFMGEEYHDFTIPRFGVDVAAMNAAVFAALKPGGLYVILDHQAADGAGISVAGTLHRIEAAELRRQVEAAGFVFDGESDAVRVPEDNHTLSVFDESIRGRTDRFVYRFRKPA